MYLNESPGIVCRSDRVRACVSRAHRRRTIDAAPAPVRSRDFGLEHLPLLEPREAEVGDDALPLPAVLDLLGPLLKEHVLGLQVPVHDGRVVVVHVGHALRHAQQHGEAVHPGAVRGVDGGQEAGRVALGTELRGGKDRGVNVTRSASETRWPCHATWAMTSLREEP